jgi:hypothetical protein
VVKARFATDEGYKKDFKNCWSGIRTKFKTNGLLGRPSGRWTHPISSKSMRPLSEGFIVGANKRALLNFCGIGKHQKKRPQEVERASFRVDGDKRINHFPKNRTDVRHSSESAPKLCDVSVRSMLAADVFSTQVDFVQGMFQGGCRRRLSSSRGVGSFEID